MLIKSSYYNIYLAAPPERHLSVIDQQKMEKENENENKREGKKRDRKEKWTPTASLPPILHPKYAT